MCIGYGAPWDGNDKETQRRVNADIAGTSYEYNEKKYDGVGILEKLKNKTIIEVLNEIDQSKYVLTGTGEDAESTGLLKQYDMPQVEVIYIYY